MALKPFYQAYDESLAAVMTVLKSENKKNGKLSGIRSIVLANMEEDTSKKTAVKAPALWIFPSTAVCEGPFGLAELWTIPIGMVMITESKNPSIGRKKSAELLNKARNVLLENKRLGTTETVQDIQSSIFDEYPEIEDKEEFDSEKHPTFAIMNMKIRSIG